MAKSKTPPGRRRKTRKVIQLEIKSIELRKTRGKGRGVFALRALQPGELIEHAPVIRVPKKEWALMRNTVLYDYAFEWSERTNDAALVMGLGSFYNHSYSPNAELESDEKGPSMKVFARRAIQPGEEITVNYLGTGRHAPLWFKVKK